MIKKRQQRNLSSKHFHYSLIGSVVLRTALVEHNNGAISRGLQRVIRKEVVNSQNQKLSRKFAETNLDNWTGLSFFLFADFGDFDAQFVLMVLLDKSLGGKLKSQTKEIHRVKIPILDCLW